MFNAQQSSEKRLLFVMILAAQLNGFLCLLLPSRGGFCTFKLFFSGGQFTSSYYSFPYYLPRFNLLAKHDRGTVAIRVGYVRERGEVRANHKVV